MRSGQERRTIWQTRTQVSEFRMRSFLILLVLLSLKPAFAQNSYSQAVKHFVYDSHAPLDIREISVREHDGVKIHDLTYASPRGGVVPAYLVVPSGKGKFAAILWGHWMMPNSPTANRSEFLNEAVALAPAGVVSLLIDAPMVRPGFKPNRQALDPLSADGSELVAQQVVDFRRGIDLLLSRDDVDPKRIAFVGHSYGAECGSILDAVDKRPVAFVFMGSPISVREVILSSEFRKSVSAEKFKEYLDALDAYGWADDGTYAAHLGPAPAFFQYALHDQFVSIREAKDYFKSSSGPKLVKFYDSNHALNAQALKDRYEFLRKHLALSKLPPGALEKVPPTK